MDKSKATNQPTKTNGLAVAGFVLAFLFPLIGLILSIIGLTKAKDYNGSGRGLSIAGIVISSVLLLISLLFIMGIAAGVNEATKNSSTIDGGSKTAKTNDEPNTAKVGEAATDGKFQFTVTDVECDKSSVGTNQYLTQEAQGQFCLVKVTVKNTGSEAQYFDSSSQYLYDAADAKFSADGTASLYANPKGSTFLNQINPGNSVSGILVFDLPKEKEPVTAELHDSPFSYGVKVNLQ